MWEITNGVIDVKKNLLFNMVLSMVIVAKPIAHRIMDLVWD